MPNIIIKSSDRKVIAKFLAKDYGLTADDLKATKTQSSSIRAIKPSASKVTLKQVPHKK